MPSAQPLKSPGLLLGIDIGGTKIRLGVAAPRSPHKLIESLSFPTPRSFAQAQPLIIETATQLLGGQSIAAIGVTSPAPVDRARGVIGHPTHLHWQKAAISTWLKHHWRRPVTLLNDASAAGICEAQYGSGRRHRYCLYVSISTGIGTALILDGWPLPGPHNSEGGRMILPGDDGLITQYQELASGRAIVRQFGHIAADIRQRQAWATISQHIAAGLYNLIVITDPEIVIFGGGVSLHHKRFLPGVQSALKQYAPLYSLPPLVPAHYLEQAPLIGALCAAVSPTGLGDLPKPGVS